MSTSAILAGLALGALALAVQLFDRRLREGPGRGRRVEGARWAARRDLRPLRVEGPKRGRLVLGRSGRWLLAAEERASVLVVGPSTTSLKTSGFAIPAVLEWEGPVLATSVKSDLLLATLKRRRRLGKAMVFDPTGASGIETVRATPLSACGSWRGAMRVAHRLASSARSAGAGGLQDAAFWYSAAEKLMAPLLFAAATGGGEMADVIRWLHEELDANEEVRERLVAAREAKEALAAWKANLNREDRQRSSIYTTAETILAAFADPRVLEATSKAEYTPAGLLDGKANTLYLCAPAHEQERLCALFTAMVAELVSVVYESSARTGKPIDPPLLIVLDEAANVAPLPDLAGLASTGAGQGIQLITVFQDVAQVHTRYGGQAQTILNNHRARMFCGGSADPETIRLIGHVIGDGEFRQRSETNGKGPGSETEASTYRALAPPNVIRGSKPGSGLLVYGHLPPAQLRLRPWFEDRGLAELVETGKRDGC